jgi:catechol 2,3-dioxygenase-like lactoylglutathione lyase family enzyme
MSYGIRCHSNSYFKGGVARSLKRFPMMIRGLKFAGIPVTDQDRALAFYRDVLGFRVVTDQPMDGNQRWIELRIPGTDTGVALFTPQGHEDRIGAYQNLSFWTDDVHKTFEELRSRGVEFEGEPAKQEWGTYVIFNDPDKNKFVLGTR